MQKGKFREKAPSSDHLVFECHWNEERIQTAQIHPFANQITIR